MSDQKSCNCDSTVGSSIEEIEAALIDASYKLLDSSAATDLLAGDVEAFAHHLLKVPVSKIDSENIEAAQTLLKNAHQHVLASSKKLKQLEAKMKAQGVW